MANLLAPKDDETASQTSDQSVAGGTSGAPGTSVGGGDSPAAIGNAPNASQATKADPNQISSLNQGADFQPLADYVSGQGTKAKSSINEAQNTFNTGLGAAPVFGQQQQSTLSDVLGGRQGLDVGQNLLNTKYSGPQGVDRTTYDPLIQQYTTSANQTGNSSGLQSLIGSMYPALSAGERNYDALNYMNNPAWRQQSQGFITDANTVQGLGDTTAQNALNAVNQRQADIGTFNTAAKNWVTGQRDTINQSINNQMNAVNSQQAQATDAINRLKAGTANWGDFDPSLFGFNPAQYNPQTVGVDQSKYIVPQGTYGPGQQWGASMMSQVGFPGGLPTPTQTALMAPGTFSQTVDPRQFLQYQAGQPLTRIQAATADQAKQYDIAEQLLNEYDYLDPTQAKGMKSAGQIGLDQSALQQALSQAGSQRDKVAQQDQDWVNQWSKGPEAIPGVQGGMRYQTPQGGIPVDASGKPLSQAQIQAASAPQPNNPTSPNNQMLWYTDPALWAQMTGGGGGGGGEGGQGFASGGLVQPQDINDKDYQGKNVQAIGFQDGGVVPNLDTLSTQPVNTPASTDTVPARVTPGEYVVNKQATQAVGPQNMQALNLMSQKSPMQQAMIRNALQTALAKAAVMPQLSTADVGAQNFRASPGSFGTSGSFGQGVSLGDGGSSGNKILGAGRPTSKVSKRK